MAKWEGNGLFQQASERLKRREVVGICKKVEVLSRDSGALRTYLDHFVEPMVFLASSI